MTYAQRVAAILVVLCGIAVSGCRKSEPAPHDAIAPIALDSAELADARKDSALALAAQRDTTAKDDIRQFLAVSSQYDLLQLQQTLARLGYPVTLSGEVDEATRAGIRSFERRHGLPQRGDPNTPELRAAMRRVNRETLNMFQLPMLDISTRNWFGPRATVHAQGTWAPFEPPRQTSDIWCFRALAQCRETTAYVRDQGLVAESLEYQIERWDDDQIVARSEAICVTDVIAINRASKSASLLRSSRSPGGEASEFCQRVRGKSDDVPLRLVDGRAVADSLDMAAMKYFRLGAGAETLMQRLRSLRFPPAH